MRYNILTLCKLFAFKIDSNATNVENTSISESV